MTQILLIGLAAGAASALLFASIVSGSLLALPLFNLAPLPILIVALGWHHLAGVIAALLAALVLGLVFGWLFFLNFLIGIALPAWWLAYLANLARPAANGSGTALEWYPVGRLMLWAAGISAAMIALLMLLIADDAESLRAGLQRSLRSLGGLPASGSVEDAGIDLTGRWFLRRLLEFPERVLPPIAAALTTLMQLFMLWLAGRIVRISGRLRRPWPDISEMRFPPTAALALLVACVGAFLPGMMGIAASTVAAALLTAYGLLGLAVLHAVSRPWRGRAGILATIYGGIVILGWPLLLMAVLALLDALLDFRARMARMPPPALPG
jgi:hypothetical protein